MNWTPWHEVVEIRPDLLSGELTLQMFAADLYDVMLQKNEREVYEDPKSFFELTYASRSLRDLVTEVAARLEGESTKAVRQLAMTYGGGKTHTLITLYHLFGSDQRLPDVPAVNEFEAAIGGRAPVARIAAVPFDNLDLERGIEVRSPDGELRTMPTPWAAIAWQLGGEQGLELLGGKGAERETAPRENVLTDILSLPSQNEDRATLILLDEVLMYLEDMVAHSPNQRKPLLNFFQCLTQAVQSVDRCCLVASLLSSDPTDYEDLGSELSSQLFNIFDRVSEEAVKPIQRADVGEVLRRRLFTLESTRDRDAFRSHVVAIRKALEDVDESLVEYPDKLEERFERSYPFHPGLLDVLYTKWADLRTFQRTRGVLRVMAMAVREAAEWDQSPLIGPNAFLPAPGSDTLPQATLELAKDARESTPDQQETWSTILEGELLDRATNAQQNRPGLAHREVEQFVFGIFLHSQPKGKKAAHTDVMRLVSPTRPDTIELEEGLRDYLNTSWFLDEEHFTEAGSDALPEEWRLGSNPNLNQLHNEARKLVKDLVDDELRQRIADASSLTEGAQAAGATVHRLPKSPADVKDDRQFRYVLLGPEAASDAGMPSDRAVEFLEKKKTERVHKNAIVCVTPATAQLERARKFVRDALAWQRVDEMLEGDAEQNTREQRLRNRQREADRKANRAVVDAYEIAVTLDKNGDPIVFRVSRGDEPLFARLLDTPQARIRETAINAEAMLPNGPYDLWLEDDTARPLRYLVRAFAEQTRLPKIIDADAITETISQGCIEGHFVLQYARPDDSLRTYWREQPQETLFDNSKAQAVLSEEAELTSLRAGLLVPDELPNLWEDNELLLGDLYEYFSEGRVVPVERQDHTDYVGIPAATRDAIDDAVKTAVRRGDIWLTGVGASVYEQAPPEDALIEDAVLHKPPEIPPVTDLLPGNLPDAWSDEQTTAADIDRALADRHGVRLPWGCIEQTIQNGLHRGFLAKTDDTHWPVPREDAAEVNFKLSDGDAGRASGGTDPTTRAGKSTARSDAHLALHEIQELAEIVGQLQQAATDVDFDIKVALTVEGDEEACEQTVEYMNALLEEHLSRLTLDLKL